MSLTIEINTDNDPFLVPVNVAGRPPFKVQLHRMIALSGKVEGNESAVAAVKGSAMPSGAADACTDDELLAVYYQAAQAVQKAQAQGNG